MYVSHICIHSRWRERTEGLREHTVGSGREEGRKGRWAEVYHGRPGSGEGVWAAVQHYVVRVSPVFS